MISTNNVTSPEPRKQFATNKMMDGGDDEEDFEANRPSHQKLMASGIKERTAAMSHAEPNEMLTRQSVSTAPFSHFKRASGQSDQQSSTASQQNPSLPSQPNMDEEEK